MGVVIELLVTDRDDVSLINPSTEGKQIAVLGQMGEAKVKCL